MKMEQTLCYSRKMLVENGETLKWWFSRIMMLVFFSFGLVWFAQIKYEIAAAVDKPHEIY